MINEFEKDLVRAKMSVGDILKVTTESGNEYTMSINDLVKVFKERERQPHFLKNKWSVKVTQAAFDDNPLYITFTGGSYLLSKVKDDTAVSFTSSIHPAISTHLIRRGFDSVTVSSNLEQYISLLYGERAPSGYWANMSDDDYNEILHYHMSVIIGAPDKWSAVRVTTNDVRSLKVPPLVRTIREFKIIKLVQTVFPEVNSWDMVNLPKGTADDSLLLTCLDILLERYDISIDDVTGQLLKSEFPWIVGYKTLRQVKEIYKESKK